MALVLKLGSMALRIGRWIFGSVSAANPLCRPTRAPSSSVLRNCSALLVFPGKRTSWRDEHVIIQLLEQNQR